MYKIDGFADKGYIFPPHDVPESEKGREWVLRFLKAIYSDYLRDNTSLGFGKIDEMKRLRMYGAGKQSNEIYKDFLLGAKDKQSGKRKGYQHINWDVFSPWPKFINIVIGIFEGIEHEVIPTAVDPKSGAEKEDMMWEAWFNKVHGAWFNEIKEAVNLPKDEQPYIPESFNELEMQRDMGTFKVRAEVAIEKLIKAVESASDIDELKRKIIVDFINLNMGATMTVVDPYSGKVKYEYADPMMCGAQYSRKRGYDNSEYCYQFENVSVLEAKRMFGLTDDQAAGVARQYGNYLNNLNGNSFDRYEMAIENGGYGYDSFKIPVMHGWYRTRNTEFSKVKKNRYGHEMLYKEEFGAQPKNENEKIKKTPIHVVYHGKWILGTEYVCDYGPMKDMIRPKENIVDLPIKMYALEGKSLTATVIPNLDNIALNFYRFQDAIATAPKPGMAIEFSSLQNISLGSASLTPLEVLKIRRQTGDLLYKATTHQSKNAVNSGRPVYPIEGGLGNQLREFIDIFEYNFEVIRTLTGINRLADGSAPKPSDQVGTSNLAVMGTENALKPIYSGYLHLKEKLANHAVARIQGLIKKNKIAYETYLPVIGSANTEVLKISEDDILRTYEFSLRPKPTAQMKESIRTAAYEAMKPGKNGNSAFSMADFAFLEQELNKGNIKYAQAYLSYKVQKAQERDERLAKENQQAQAQSLQELEMLKDQNEQKQHERKLEYLNAEWDRRDQNEELKMTGKFSSDVMQNEYQLENQKNNLVQEE